ncbi:hypothetical protein M885DRAFT_37705 [Pelagophyceae sp. CCMP2097]|nr:hypothetical protein M885DRAFT_37705 [Pelagophyceae sp. CCMP2097]
MSLGDARRAGAPRGRDGLFGGADLDAPQSPQRGDGAAECAASDAAAAVRPQWPLRRDGLSPALQLAFRPFRPRPRPRVRGRAFEAWDFEAVATVVYLCCSAFAHGTDVFEKAADVADAFWEEQVCGRGLAEMLRRDASYGFILLAGVLPRPGSRANVVGSLRAYVSAHGREDWPVSSEAGAILLSFPLSVSLLKFEDRDDEVHASASLDRFKAVTCPGGFGDLVSTTYLLANAAFKKGKSETSATMPMPLFVTLLINELKEELGNADKVVMVGTLVIRSMFDTDTLVGVDGKQSPRPLLKVNESEVTGEQLRMLSSKMEEMVDSHVYARTTTYSLEVPTTRRNVFARAPFNITSFEFSLDFQPLLARLPNGKFIKFVPDLLCPIGDLRELVSVEPERLDEIHKFDLINPNPSVEVELVSEAERITHAPSMKITFFGDTDAVRALLNIIIPIIFIAFGNVLNVLYCEDYDNFLANALTLGLTLVFFIPTLNQIESGSNEMDLNQLLVVLLFLGLVFGCMDCKRCNGGTNHLIPLHFQTLRHVVRATSFALLWGSIVIPVSNLILYLRVKWRLRGAAYGRGRGFYSSGGSHLKGSWFTGRPSWRWALRLNRVARNSVRKRASERQPGGAVQRPLRRRRTRDATPAIRGRSS